MQKPTEQFSRPEVPWNSKDCKANYPDILVPLLKHNGPIPSQLTKGHILKIQSDTERSLINPEVEISSVDAQILALQQKRQELVQQATPGWMTLDACKKGLAPIRNIPLEIFREIVLYALPSQPYPTLNHAPISLSHVCRDWRKALLNFPQAWQELFLEVDVAVIHLRNQQYIAQSWFSRAKELPVSLYLHFDHDGCRWHEGGVEGFDDIVARFLKGISSLFPRIRHLGLSADQVLDCLRFLTKSEFSTLDSLMLHMNKPTSLADYSSYVMETIDVTGDSYIFAFQKLLNLRKLVLDDPVSFHGPGRRMFPWAQLTDLDFGRQISGPGLIRLLKLCPQLRKGSFHLSEEDVESDDESSVDDSDDEEEAKPVHHNLEDLRVYVHDERIRVNWCFEACRFPGLRLLHLSHDHEFVDVGRGGEVGQDFPPEFSSLQVLSVNGNWLESPEPLQQLFTAAASVNSL